MIDHERILVIAPHPDDEVLLAAGVIRRAVLEGKHISVAVVTNGDYLCNDYSKGEARLRESLLVLQRLGVPQQNIYLLGYPDTGYEPEVSFLTRLWGALPNEQLASSASSCTYALPEHADYCMRRTGSHAPYTRRAFCDDLDALLCDVQPDLIITTAESDLHGDHSALPRFVRQAIMQGLPAKATLWAGMVHSPDGDLCWPQLTQQLTGFEQPTGEWGEALAWARRITVPLPAEMLTPQTADSEKYNLISRYKTALNPSEPEVCSYLLAFAKNEELFWEVG